MYFNFASVMKNKLNTTHIEQITKEFIKNIQENTLESTQGKHRLNLSMPAETYDELKAQSKKRGLTITAYILNLINKSLNKE